MKSNFTVVPDWTFQDIFPEELRLTFASNQEDCRVQVKAGNMLFIIMSDGRQLAFSVENVQHTAEYAELKFTLKKENAQPGWPVTSTMTLSKREDFTFEGVLIGEGFHEKVILKSLS